MMAPPGFNDVLGATLPPYLGPARARPFVKWAGGKRALLPEIARRLPPAFGTYWEPFLGGGAVFFALESRIGAARLSDLNAELMLAWQMVKKKPQQLVAVLAGHAARHAQRSYYNHIRDQHALACPLQVAGRFIYLNKTCFNGLYRVNRQGRFNVPKGRYGKPAICDEAGIAAASAVLEKAALRIGDFRQTVPAAGDFVYCDPPYDGTGTGAMYDAAGFGDDEQRALRDRAREWAGSGAAVMLSNANTPLIHRLYSEAPFVLHRVAAPRPINRDANGRGPVGELIITTY